MVVQNGAIHSIAVTSDNNIGFSDVHKFLCRLHINGKSSKSKQDVVKPLSLVFGNSYQINGKSIFQRGEVKNEMFIWTDLDPEWFDFHLIIFLRLSLDENELVLKSYFTVISYPNLTI